METPAIVQVTTHGLMKPSWLAGGRVTTNSLCWNTCILVNLTHNTKMTWKVGASPGENIMGFSAGGDEKTDAQHLALKCWVL